MPCMKEKHFNLLKLLIFLSNAMKDVAMAKENIKTEAIKRF